MSDSLAIWAMAVSQWQAKPGTRQCSEEGTNVHTLWPEHAVHHWRQGAVRLYCLEFQTPQARLTITPELTL